MANGFETQFVITDPTKVVDAVAMWLEQAGLALTSANCDVMDVVIPSLDAKSTAGIAAMRSWSAAEILADKLEQMAALLSDAAPMLTAKGTVA